MNPLKLWLENLEIGEAFSLQAGQAIRQGSVILTGMLLVKLRLGAGDIGIYETALYLGSAVSFFWLNAFMQSFSVIYPGLTVENRRVRLWNMFFLCCAVSAGLFIALRVGNDFLLKFLTGTDGLPYLRVYLLFLLFSLPASLLEIVLLLDRNPKKQLYYFIWSYGLQTLTVLFPVAAGQDFIDVFYGLAALGAFRLAYLCVYIFRSAGRPAFFPKALQPFWPAVWPLIGYGFLSGFAPFFDGWLVGRFYHHSTAIFAVFRYGAREFPLSLALSTGLSAAAAAALSRDFTSGLPDLKRRAARLQNILFPSAIALMLASKPLFLLLFNRSFAQSADLFTLYLLLTLSRTLFPQTVLLALKDTKGILKISAAETLVNIILDLSLIASWGLKGVAAATVIAYLFEKAALMRYIKNKYGISSTEYTDWGQYWKNAFLLITALAVSLYLNAAVSWSFLTR